MTKKDFELIASIIVFCKTYNYSIIKTSYEFANTLSEKYPRFNKQKFLKDCGVESDDVRWYRENTTKTPDCPHYINSDKYNPDGWKYCSQCK